MILESDLKKYKKALQKDGYFIVKNGFSNLDISEMKERLDEIINGKVKYEGRRFQQESESSAYKNIEKLKVEYQGPEVNYRKISELEYDSVFLSKLKKQCIRKICTTFVGETCSIMRTTMMNKTPKKGSKLPWHQDVNKNWPTLIQPKLAIWFSLDPLNENNGTIEVINESHKHGMIGTGHLLKEDLLDLYAPSHKINKIIIGTGDILFFDAYLLHRSGINKTNLPRRAINIILMPGTVKHTQNMHNYPVLFGDNELIPSTL